MNSTNTTTFFVNTTAESDSKRASVTISIEEFEELMSYKQKHIETQNELEDIKESIQAMLKEDYL